MNTTKYVLAVFAVFLGLYELLALFIPKLATFSEVYWEYWDYPILHYGFGLLTGVLVAHFVGFQKKK